MESDVPEGWERVRLGEVLENPRDRISKEDLNGRKVLYFSIPQYDETGGGRVEDGENIGSAKYRVPSDCVLISRLNPRIPRILHVTHDAESLAVCSTEFWPLVSVGGAVEHGFLKYFLQSGLFRLNPKVAPASSTRSHQRIKRKPFETLRLLLPPLPEQKKIAAILSTVDEAIETTEAVIEQTRRVKKGLLEELLTRGIGHEEFTETRIGEIPEGWEVKRVEDLAEVRTGAAKNTNKDRENPVELPYLRVANVQDGYLDLDEIKTIEVERDRIDRYALKDGDVLMTEGGDIDKLGRGYIWRGEIENCLHQNHVFAVRCRENRILPEYFGEFVSSETCKRYFMAVGKQTTNLASINKTLLRGLPVPVPPLEEQREIARRLSAFSEAMEAQEEKLEEIRTLKRGLLQDLLSGEVRVGDVEVEEIEEQVEEAVAV